jgi:hypothetical protein
LVFSRRALSFRKTKMFFMLWWWLGFVLFFIGSAMFSCFALVFRDSAAGLELPHLSPKIASSATDRRKQNHWLTACL